MAEDVAENRDSDIFEIAELDDLLPGFDDYPFNFNHGFFPEPWVSESGALPHVNQNADSAPPLPSDPASVDSDFLDCLPCFVSSGERFEEAGVGPDDGASDLVSKDFVHCSNREKIDAESPKAYDEEGRDRKRIRMPAVAEDEDDDPISKNLRRKMRNRESAMKSRERKKIYTKDLEMKCKFLESECRRLDYLLRCCVMDNSVLRQSLQFKKERFCNASMDKQESAVLFVETLPLVSLFCLMSVVCLFLVPNLQCPNLKILSRRGRRNLAPMIVDFASSPEIVRRSPTIVLVEKLRRRYRGFRSRIKQLLLFLLHASVLC